MGTIDLISSGIPNLLPQARGAGTHLTDIIRAIGIKYGYTKPYKDAKDEQGRPVFSPETRSRMQLGLTLEYALLLRMNEHDREQTGRGYDRYVRIGELTVDNVLMNLDFYDTVVGEPIECKLTWRSSSHAIDSNTYWKDWTQTACYARAMGSLSGRLLLCHVDGDYSFPKQVVHNDWRQTWEQAELDDIWAMIVNHKSLVQV